MATKVFCDACRKEGASNKFRYLCHLTRGGVSGYADADGNPVSGREDCVDLCNRCYNTIVSCAVKKMKELQGT